MGCEVMKEGGVPFADGEARGQGGGGSGRFDITSEEGDCVVGDVMMQPGKYCTGFVGGRGKGGRELVC